MHSDYPFSGQTSPAMYWPMANSRKLERLHFVCGHGEDVARAGDMEHQRSCCDHLAKAQSNSSIGRRSKRRRTKTRKQWWWRAARAEYLGKDLSGIPHTAVLFASNYWKS